MGVRRVRTECRSLLSVLAFSDQVRVSGGGGEGGGGGGVNEHGLHNKPTQSRDTYFTAHQPTEGFNLIMEGKASLNPGLQLFGFTRDPHGHRYYKYPLLDTFVYCKLGSR